jgi:membrane protein
MKATWKLLRDTYSEFSSDNASLFGAALAYYAFFSLAPLLVIVIALAGSVLGTEAARGEVIAQLRGLLGSEGAEAVRSLLEGARQSREGVTASVIGGATLVLGATRVFTNLQTALNVTWDASPDRDRGLRGSVTLIARKRAVSFAMVLGIGGLLVASLFASTALSALGGYLSDVAPAPAELVVYRLSDLAGSFAVVTLVLAAVYRFLPDTDIAWRDVWLGAMVTALLLTAGKFVIGWYLGSKSIGSVFGAAGSLVALLLWVYYSAQIVLFGAEMTQVFAVQYGSRNR